MKILKFLLLSTALFLYSCVGSDLTSLPSTIEEAKNDKLLIHIYRPSQRCVIINNSKYYLEDAFTTFKFNSKRDLTINKNFFSFIIKLKNIKTGEKMLAMEDDYGQFINFHADNGGIHDSNLSLNYDDISLREKLDTITIGFKNRLKKETPVKFIKIK
ncbi:MAG: hypothetical protein DI622_14275 [Chryseobacterium sp.]|uniref:hypothetical protein n=1 Tax=Chryseobacterium sp. TaxID=1871047 RepID=UPI000DAF6FF1|nr:hypothetical protein [Chryseobacterium sp.]MPS66126.1 hypothetical protein [Chryseobacterium sp.]PZU13325.1 MAG: hypothetical protein DI622_14275 [Chryseobacterium sp.]